jgi:hypothetical protein
VRFTPDTKVAGVWARLWQLGLAIGAGAAPRAGWSKAGMRISPDSAQYLAAAQNLLSGRGYVGTDDRLLGYWPPGYSSALALVGTFVPDLLIAALLVNMVCLAAVGWFVFDMCRLLAGGFVIPTSAVVLVALNRAVGMRVTTSGPSHFRLPSRPVPRGCSCVQLIRLPRWLRRHRSVWCWGQAPW